MRETKRQSYLRELFDGVVRAGARRADFERDGSNGNREYVTREKETENKSRCVTRASRKRET